ncbi:MAG: DUF4240 domain-containing protein [Oscillospiraceae bacterium]|nr:DUF4240 domain-containing protein [Oscillospiraceae bacterium]
MINNTAINAINFPDDKFRQYIADFDKDNNSVTEIDVTEMGISSLKGIEHFPNLAVLKCGCNELTALDISGNTALIELECNDNHLTSLDVSKNIKLDDLNCDNNQLTELDVSKNTALTKLYCDGNQLTSIDISKNTELIELTVNENQLKSLDVSHNTKLYLFYCFSNQLTSLDVSVNTELTGLECGGNQLTSLDVSNNTKLVEFYCYDNQLSELDVSQNTALDLLCFYNNQLTSIDVSKNIALTKLHCWENQLTSLDVSANTALTEFECGKNQLTSLDVSNNTSLVELRCYDNQIEELDMSNNAELVVLLCHRNQLKELNVSKNVALTELDCWANQLTSLDISDNTALTELGCSTNQLTSLDVSNNVELTKLTCHRNQLTEFDVSNNVELTELACGENQLTSLNVSNNTKLIDLSCGDNQLSALDMSNNLELTDLDCGNNRLSLLDISKNTALKKFAPIEQNLSIWLKGETVSQLEKDYPLPKEKWRILTFGAIISLRNLGTIKSLWSYNSDKETRELEHWWGITERKGAISTLKSLASTNPNRGYDYKRFVANKSESNENYSETLDILKELGYTDEELTKVQTLVAYDYGRILYIARASFVSGYITEDEAWFYLSIAAKKASRIYNSWREYAAAYALGRTFMFSGGIKDIKWVMQFLLHDPDSPFQYCEFRDEDTAAKAENALTINEINFPDAVFRQYITDKFDKTNSGIISAEELNNATIIDVAEMGIVSLKGIEHFPNLAVLNCDINELSELDVSQNTKLFVLTCNNNKLTSLDIGENADLTDLKKRFDRGMEIKKGMESGALPRMSIERFWELIHDAKEQSEGWEEMCDPLTASLSQLEDSEIALWYLMFDEYQQLSYKEQLWAAAYLINGGCSDDGFDYFRAWLIAQGREVYMNALRDPDSLSEAISETEEAEFEDIMSAANDAFRIKHELGKNDYGSFYEELDYYELTETEKAEISAEIKYSDDIDADWDEDDTDNFQELLPKLWGKRGST